MSSSAGTGNFSFHYQKLPYMRYKIEDIPEGKRLVLSRPLDSINKWMVK